MVKKFFRQLRKEQKYTIFTNLVLGFFAIVFAIIDILSAHRKFEPQFLISYMLILLSAVIIHLITSEYSYFKRNDTKFHRLMKRDDLQRETSLESLFRKACEIDIVTASNTLVFGDRGAHLLDLAERNGIKCRFVSLNPNSEASKEFLANKSPNLYGLDDRFDKQVISCIDQQYKNHTTWFNNFVEYYLTSVNISFGIMLFRNKQKRIFFARVDFYALEIGSANRPCMCFDELDVEALDLFSSQFKLLLDENKSREYFIKGKFNEDLWGELHPNEHEAGLTSPTYKSTGDEV